MAKSEDERGVHRRGHVQVLLLDPSEDDGTGRGRMSVRRRTSNTWVGVVIVGAMLLSRHLAAADRRVHDVQIVASRLTYEPSTVQVSAGEAVRLVVRSNDSGISRTVRR